MPLRFTDADALLRYEPNLEAVYPRRDRDGRFIRDWGIQIDLAMEEIGRRLRNRSAVPEHFELGRLGIRSQGQLAAAASSMALHYIFVAADTQGDPDGYFHRKARYYWERAEAQLEAEMAHLDYDSDNSGTIDALEKNQPVGAIMFIRG